MFRELDTRKLKKLLLFYLVPACGSWVRAMHNKHELLTSGMDFTNMKDPQFKIIFWAKPFLQLSWCKH